MDKGSRRGVKRIEGRVGRREIIGIGLGVVGRGVRREGVRGRGIKSEG